MRLVGSWLVVACLFVGCSEDTPDGGITFDPDTSLTTTDTGDDTTGEDTTGEATTGGETTGGETTGTDTTGGDTTGGDTTGGDTADTTGGQDECSSSLDCLDKFEEIGLCEEPLCANGDCVLIAVPDCCECTEDSVCDDSDACTDDVCTGECGQCLNVAKEGCCAEDSDCDDNDQCTADSCLNGQCENLGGECCVEDVDCDDSDVCTFDFCGNDGTCEHDATAECCSGPQDCDDGNPCTVDVCNDAVGVCTNTTLGAGCCTEDAACDDGDQCTNDACIDSKCVSTPGACCTGPDDCDDGNACTVDTCGDAGVCLFDALQDCCTEASDCDDSNACTEDLCFAGKCLNSDPAPGCCAADGDCNDNNSCTADSCVNGSCVNAQGDEPCCTESADCDDDNACTAEVCLAGQCIISDPDPDCCIEDAACDDGNACTFDLCFANACLHSDVGEGCCTEDAVCDDSSACTTDTCVTNACVFTPVDNANCCDVAADCSDDNPCTAEVCLAGQCIISAPDPDCCLDDGACDDGNPCTTDACGPNNACVAGPIAGCCVADADCGDGNDCSTDTCNLAATGTGECAYAPVANCCDPGAGDEIAHMSFVPGVVDGVQFGGQNSTYRWREGSAIAFAGPASMYFGNGDNDEYCGNNGGPFGGGGGPAEADATLFVGNLYPDGGVSLPEGTTVQLEFQARLDIREAADVDVLEVFVASGGNTTLVWDKGDADAAAFDNWALQKVDLTAFAGTTIQLFVTFDVVNSDGCDGAGAGPRIDEVSIKVADCATPTGCTQDGDCNEPPNADCFAATGTCDGASGECSYAPNGLCCTVNADCADGKNCTNDACIGGQCINQVLLGCCEGDDECVTDNACTVGTCNVATNECLFLAVDDPLCCLTVDDCSPGNLFCSGAVSCEANTCTTAPSDQTADHLSFVFTNAADGWDSDNDNNLHGWTETGEDPNVSAYFGKLFNAGFLDPYCSEGFGGTPSGTANFPASGTTFAFDASGTTTLSFDINMDVRQDASVDTLQVVMDDTATGQTTVWTKADLQAAQFGDFVTVTLDVTNLAPFNGNLRVAFDVVDEDPGGDIDACWDSGDGVFVDNIKVAQSCNAAP